MQVLRTEKCKIKNYTQVKNKIDKLSVSTCKLWNVARYECEKRWKETGEILLGNQLKNKLKKHEKWKKLHSQTAQNVIEELQNACSTRQID